MGPEELAEFLEAAREDPCLLFDWDEDGNCQGWSQGAMWLNESDEFEVE